MVSHSTNQDSIREIKVSVYAGTFMFFCIPKYAREAASGRFSVFVHEGGKHGFLQNSKNRTTLPSGWFNGVKCHAGAA